MAIGPLLLRLVAGVAPPAHWAQKVLAWFCGLGLDATGQAFATLGVRAGRRHALLAGVTEIAAGALLVLGLAAPLAATMVGSIMIVAAASVHAMSGSFITQVTAVAAPSPVSTSGGRPAYAQEQPVR